MKKIFCESVSMLKDVGGITDYRFLSVSEQAQSYTCYFIITVHNEERDFDITVSGDGIRTIVIFSIIFYSLGQFQMLQAAR